MVELGSFMRDAYFVMTIKKTRFSEFFCIMIENCVVLLKSEVLSDIFAERCAIHLSASCIDNHHLS
jgi:hypothetical protein